MHGEYFRSKMGQILKVRHRSGRFYSTFQIFSALFSDTNSEVDDLIQILKCSAEIFNEIFSDTDSGVDDSTQHQRPKSARGIAPINTTLPSINTSRL